MTSAPTLPMRSAAARAAARPLGEALALPRVERAPLAALNRLYRRQPPWPVAVGTRQAWLRWDWQPAERFARHHAAGLSWRLGAASGWLVLEPRAQEALLEEREAARLPLDLRCVLLSDALAGVLSRVEQASGERFEWTLPQEAAPLSAAAWAASFSFHFEGAPQERHHGLLALDALPPLALLAAAGPALDPAAPALGPLRLPLAFELGRSAISLRELRGVARGDIVAIERWRGQGRGIAVVPCIGGALRLGGEALADGAQITLSPDEEITMTGLESPEAAPAAAPGRDRLDDMEVALRFEVGELSLTLRELRGLAPGHVFDLGQPLNRCAVRIYAHANLLGQGHLVAIGDQLGVRVSAFAADVPE